MLLDRAILMKNNTKNSYFNTIALHMKNAKKTSILSSQKILKLKLLNEESKKNGQTFSSSKIVTMIQLIILKKLNYYVIN